MGDILTIISRLEVGLPSDFKEADTLCSYLVSMNILANFVPDLYNLSILCKICPAKEKKKKQTVIRKTHIGKPTQQI